MTGKLKNLDTNSKILLVSVLFVFIFHAITLVPKINFSVSSYTPEKPKQEESIIKLSFGKKKDKIKHQIVANEKRGTKNIDEDTKFLSDMNQTYSRQVRAKKVAKFNEAGKGLKTGTDLINRKVKKVAAPKKLNLKSFSFSEVKKIDKTEIRPLKMLGAQTGNVNKKGLSASSDFIEELPLGDFTQLNTKEYKYYGFYFRIKQKLEQFWGSGIQEMAKKLYSRGRRLPATQNYITSLVIKMNRIGKITSIDVKSTSGVRELDTVAIKAFNKAGPFPNPPKALVVNNEVSINWSFAVTASK
jgi:TonB family protein